MRVSSNLSKTKIGSKGVNNMTQGEARERSKTSDPL